ncbi:MAG: hypothetical protein R6V47_05795 [Candidatus Delongbacteria bacterium]
MKILRIVLIFFTVSVLRPEYITGDFVENIEFADSNVNELSEIVYSEQSIKEIISSGRVAVISFFVPG